VHVQKITYVSGSSWASPLASASFSTACPFSFDRTMPSRRTAADYMMEVKPSPPPGSTSSSQNISLHLRNTRTP